MVVRFPFTLVFLLAGPAAGETRGARPDAASVPEAVSESPSDPRPGHVRALLAGTLDVNVAPQSLFDVPLADEDAVRVEAARLRALVRAAEQAADSEELRTLDAARWAKRLELDAARLAFYDLDAAQREQLLTAHAARQAAARPQDTEAERLRQDAEAEQAALEAARTEAERVVADEVGRLRVLAEQVREVRAGFQRVREAVVLRRDTVLGWQRRARDARVAGPSEADATYAALGRALRAVHVDLATALDEMDARSAVPETGPDALVDLPSDVATNGVREQRTTLERAIADARHDERALREERAAGLLDEITALNRERLGLLPSLSQDGEDAATGFSSAGWDQARLEARHLALVLRFHQHVARAWLEGVRTGGSAVSAWGTITVLLPLLFVIGAFLWGRRKTAPLLRWIEMRVATEERAARRATPSTGLRGIRILLKTHRSLETLLFFLAVFWLLPRGARDLLEVQLVSSVLTWTIAGALVVNTVNAIAAGNASGFLSLEDGESGALRHRSLRLVGRTVIVFALILVLSARLVGKGTIYSWVFSTCWFAVVPIFLVLVRWWRSPVFERLDRLRKKTPLQTWVLANRTGWKSFAAAMAGAIQLFTTGALKLARSWLSGFDLARRIHAYLFKREIERIGEQPGAELMPLPRDLFEKLSPETALRTWLGCPADTVREELIGRARGGSGALIAVVASRGMGKSSLLRAIAQESPGAKVLACHKDVGAADLRAATERAPSALLIDDAHTLIEARIGGLARFDEAIAFARAHSDATTWVFAFDASVWPLLKRARDARPMFDEVHLLAPWDERALGALLADRCDAAGIAPQYDALLDKMPPGADEIDRQDALNRKRGGYERMLWDHVGGNPGLALEAWRVSLGMDAAAVIHVRPLQVPDAAKLERLPDSSLFVLRAVLQLAPTSVETIAQATRLRPEEVLQDLRFGKVLGFYEEKAGHVRVAWPWLHAVSRLLERRHLLVNP